MSSGDNCGRSMVRVTLLSIAGKPAAGGENHAFGSALRNLNLHLGCRDSRLRGNDENLFQNGYGFSGFTA